MFYILSILISVLYNSVVGGWPNDGGFGSRILSEGMNGSLDIGSKDYLVVGDSEYGVIHGPALDSRLPEYYRQVTVVGVVEVATLYVYT